MGLFPSSFKARIKMIREEYHIYRNGKFFAGFGEGDPTRDGFRMDYIGFKKEFEACVDFWCKNFNATKEEFTYTIEALHKEGR